MVSLSRAVSSAIFIVGVVVFPRNTFAQPAEVSYQGELKKDGSLYAGTASMKFAIVSAGQSLWSNDGTSSGGSAPIGSESVDCAAGIFSVRLGASPMEPISAAALQGVNDSVLRVWVDTGDGFEQLSDQPMSSSVFALAGEKVNHVFTSSNGNVGIGTLVPSAALTVVSNSGLNSDVRIHHVDAGANPLGSDTWNAISFRTNGADPSSTTFAQLHFAGSHDQNAYSLQASKVSNNMGSHANLVLNPTGGNIGIRNSSPHELLHLGSGAEATTIQVGGAVSLGNTSAQGATVLGHNAKPADSPSVGMIFMNDQAVYNGGRAIVMHSTDGIVFHASGVNAIAGNSFSSEVMRITNDGNVGLNVTSPESKLHISNGSSTNTSAPTVILGGMYEGSLGCVGAIRPNGLQQESGPYSGGISLQRNVFSGGSYVYEDVLNVTGAGNVGIGTGAPAERLDVAGNIRCVTLVETSAARFKKDIQPIHDALRKVTALKGVAFRWCDEFGGQPDLGLIGEEVAGVLPELVQCSEDNGEVAGVKYNHLTAVLVEAIKEQQAEIERLHAKLADYASEQLNNQQQFDVLTARLQRLEAVAGRTLENDASVRSSK